MLKPVVFALCLVPIASTASTFTRSLLAGTWEENASTEPVCTGRGSTLKYDLSSDGKLLSVRLSKPIDTEIGRLSSARANVVASTSRSLTIVYENEKRVRSDGKPVQWELSVVSAGIYRWRETSWSADEVNVVVGVRCTPH